MQLLFRNTADRSVIDVKLGSGSNLAAAEVLVGLIFLRTDQLLDSSDVCFKASRFWPIRTNFALYCRPRLINMLANLIHCAEDLALLSGYAAKIVFAPKRCSRNV